MISNHDFGLLIKKLRKNRKITQSEISNILGVSRQAYSNYENGLRTPDADILSGMSDFFGTNLFKYFVNNTKITKADDFSEFLIQKNNLKTQQLASLLKNKREKFSLSQNDIADIIGLSRATYSKYESGTAIPSLESLLNLSSFYRINPMELICALIPENELTAPEYKNFKCYSNDDLSLSDQELLYNYNKLTPHQKEAINNLINTFL